MDYTKLNNKAATATTTNDGLRAYMLSVYNYMTLALGVTGIVALFASSSPAIMALLYTNDGGKIGMAPLGWVVMFAPFIMVFILGAGISKMRARTAQVVFWAYAGMMGLSLTSIFLIYTGTSIASTFFITASVFGAMSLYGYTTKSDLTGMGSFMMMGLIGVILTSLVNMFLHSAGLQFAISILSVGIFVGLTAYDTQKIKAFYYASYDQESASKNAVLGALTLYLDFINLFISLLRLFGDRR